MYGNVNIINPIRTEPHLRRKPDARRRPTALAASAAAEESEGKSRPRLIPFLAGEPGPRPPAEFNYAPHPLDEAVPARFR